jgi:dTDP-4-amino-4,6-dideoxygalactose transaminase/acetyltransferase-like isoleucine patch superfamily enzyme
LSHALVHPSAIVDAEASLGAGTRVWHFCHVSAGAQLGEQCSLGQNVFIAPGVSIGNRVKIQNNVSVYAGVEIGDDAFLGPSCVFTNVLVPRSFVDRKRELVRTRVGRGASIGANATVVCGHDIGGYALVGAGAVVTSDVPAHAIVVGNPARQIGWACVCGERLPDGAVAVCGRCALRYELSGGACRPARNESASRPGEIRFFDLREQTAALEGELHAAFERVLRSGRFILADEVTQLERELAAALDLPHVVGVSSGTDALIATLMALGVSAGDEVITSPFSFIATAESIVRVGARPVFADVDADSSNLDPSCVEAAITPRTRAIIAVHLFGQPCAPEVLDVALRHDLPVVEDAAQAIGARTERGPVGGLGKAGCFSLFPSKNLGGFGDAGLVTTRDEALAADLRALRSHGAASKGDHRITGGNFRLDELQAALLRVKLPHLSRWTAARRANAARYQTGLGEAQMPAELLTLPSALEPGHVYNQYVVRTSRRDELHRYLAERGIGTEIYYAHPLHLQRCFAGLGYRTGSFPVTERSAREVLALPIYPELGETRQRRVIDEVLTFFGRATRRSEGR